MADTSNSVLFDQPGPKGRRTIRIVNWVAALIFVGVLVLILMRLHNPPDGENQLSWELWKPALEREAWTDFYLPGLSADCCRTWCCGRSRRSSWSSAARCRYCC